MVFVVLWKEGFFDDFEGVPAFEAAVIFTLGCFFAGLFFVVPLRFLGVVSRGGFGLSRFEAFEEELELGGIDLFAFGTVEKLDENVDFLLKQPDTGCLSGNDLVFFLEGFDALNASKVQGK